MIIINKVYLETYNNDQIKHFHVKFSSTPKQKHKNQKENNKINTLTSKYKSSQP